LYYVPEDELDGFLNKFEGWRSYMSELLKTQFGVDDQFVYDWDSNVGTYISKRERYRLRLCGADMKQDVVLPSHE
jgi:hypothetical protein